MKSMYILLSVLFLSFGYASCGKDKPQTPAPANNQPKTDSEKIKTARWDTKKVSGAVTWKYHHFEDLYKSKQSITVFEIDLNHPLLKIDIPYVNSGFLKTSEGAASVRAVAAINGGYFDTQTGGSTVFFRKDGETITTTRAGFTAYREDAGLAIDASGNVSIVKKPQGGWAASGASTLLVSGPLLMLEGKTVDQADKPFNMNRHPRTAVGINKDNKLIAVVVDGRNAQAQGMTTVELAGLMKDLGCIGAMNFDGGGSSTAWVRNRGVVNYPSDNSKFDHEGERGVATVIAFVEEE